MEAKGSPWLVSARFDLAVFLLPAVVALGLSALEPALAPEGDTPLPFWVLAVVLVDVAHVWATLYRTYLDPEERARRPALYAGAPLLAWTSGLALYASSAAAFWTALAYLAVFHFVRQQYGWVALYNRRAGDGAAVDRAIDAAAIYASTLVPVLWWHAHLPRRFEWFVPGDFLGGLVPEAVTPVLGAIWVAAMGAFVGRQLQRRVWRPGKLIVVLGTAACWGVGIVLTDSDFSFTVTNVLIHGVPYFAIVWLYERRRKRPPTRLHAWLFAPGLVRVLAFYGILVGLALVEEWGWDRLIWHERGELFPLPALTLPRAVEAAVVPLLALPQATHYLLDAWIWRTRPEENPELAEIMALRAQAERPSSGRVAY